MCFRHTEVGDDEAGPVDQHDVAAANNVRLVMLGFTRSGRDLELKSRICSRASFAMYFSFTDFP